MSEARSLTPLSETDYEAIASAVMETARGRWFMSEFAKRNRQADTAQLLTAMARIERVVGIGAAPATAAVEPSLREAAALIADLRLDLERISGRGEPSSGLASRIESAAASVFAATESVQETAWELREAGAAEASCDVLDRRATEIHAATAIIEGTAQQIGKIADTIAMLDSSLRAICDKAEHVSGLAAHPTLASVATPFHPLPDAAPLGAYDDIEIVEIDEAPTSLLADPRPLSARPAAELKLQASALIADDIVFEEVAAAGGPAPEPKFAPATPPATAAEPPSDPLQAEHVVAAATSEAGLRELDEMPADKKLAYFA